MAKKVSLWPHLEKETLYSLYRSSSDKRQKNHYQIIWLIASGKTVAQVSQITGYSNNWIYQLVRKYNQSGVDSLGDKRKNNGGHNSLLTDLERKQLREVLLQPSPDGGLWNGRKVADWLSQLTGKKISRHRGWEMLKSFSPENTCNHTANKLAKPNS
ncbi:helix-turn-helix domain-containing protein [Cyanobacterium stanieri LEGE 03274]|uniref:Helix-turn-helix domain-containing protein n=1 Tax=Cyanobacterium stanieri LEGE 03274 TaxID=1828756 RepID=A0ABR9V5F8_9CHRO|nr:helix-turn-helix domain-containing protein [Cyanobacterium stanieri]MBE9223123.1 helix-turn-helix domain-containing protein [Cyanobacterium stanieri LEGE 03274]